MKPVARIEAGASVSPGALQIGWTADAGPGDESWLPATPTFELSAPDVKAKAKGWVAVSLRALHVHVVVQDVIHVGRPGDLLWQGDFMRVAVDGRGDGAGASDIDTRGPFGPDDATFGLAMTPDGPLTLVLGAASPALKGRLDASQARVRRAEATHETIYDLRLPWASLEVMPGAVPNFRLAVQVKDVNPGEKDGYLRFGDGASDLRAGRFMPLAFAMPAAPFAAATVLNGSLWDGEAARVAVAVASPKPAQVRVSGEGVQLVHNVAPVAADAGLRRFIVTYLPARDATQPAFEVDVIGAGLPPLVIRHSPLLADGVFRALWRRLDELLAAPVHPLFERHVRSVRALTEAERGRMETYRNNTALVLETVEQVRSTLEGFNADAGLWSAYLDGRRSLIFAFSSPRDASLQSYYVTLPKGFDANKRREDQALFPLFVELHGAGNPHPMAWVASGLSGAAKAMDLLGYESPKNYASVDRSGYHLQPFGRGNSGYRDIGETDVWEALADFGMVFKTDPDRHYLYGFSMGGVGTWLLGSRTPDRWAALAVFGASPDTSEPISLARNLSYVPVWHWAGTEDFFAAPKFDAFNIELKSQGVPLTFSSTPQLGHVYLMAKQKEGVEWLAKHVRKRPSRFTFVADTPEHRGVWGVSVDKAAPGAPLANFECVIVGNTVRIKSHGTKGLDVRLGAEGLQMAGNVTVTWNGRPVYRGPPIDLHLPRRLKAENSAETGRGR
ncbi:MAG: hypothetical protein SF187_19415 [Deltaproteobacteria bacterium]|nr:hypothetical protein [Deltaproteobacteria bacterium]